MKYKYKLCVGDKSDDGHGKYEYIIFESSHGIDDIIDAYLESIKKSGIALHRVNLSKIKVICDDYEDYKISIENVKKLRDLGLNLTTEEDGTYWVGPDKIVYIFLEMVKTQIKGFEYKMIEDDGIQCINSSDRFDEQIGYGCFV